MSLPGGTLRDVGSLRLVFTDIRGARGSAAALTKWLRSDKPLTLEIFGSDRVATRITKNSLPDLQARHGVNSLATLLEVL